MSDSMEKWHKSTQTPKQETLGLVKYMELKGLLQPTRRPDGKMGYGLSAEARALLKAINRETGDANHDDR